LTRRFANNAIDKNEDAHFVIKAVLKNGDIYALDLTGAQYGHFDPVLPWQKYVESRASEVRTLVPLDQVRIRNNLRCEESGREGLVISANAFATSQMEQALGKWVSENLPLEAMLNLPDDSFKQKRAELLGVLKATLQDFKTSLTLEDVLKARLKFIEEGRFFYPL